MVKQFLCLALIGFMALSSVPATAANSEIDGLLKQIKLPPGFKINLFGEAKGAWSLAVGKRKNTVFVGSASWYLHALSDTDNDGVADIVKRKSNRLQAPNGVAMLDGSLYIGLRSRIVKWPGRSLNRPLTPLEPIFTGLNNRSHHGRRVIGFGPYRKLYVAVGTPCNVCMPNGNEGTILHMDSDGKNV
jgi:glucose/arabinose dehydrogenase